MTHNLDLHFFTSEQLKAHDLDIATKGKRPVIPPRSLGCTALPIQH